jgi:enolase
MSLITSILARQILDSRGNPTIEVDIVLDNAFQATASVPSGASTGYKEALELRDDDPSKFCGKGVLKAIHNVNGIIKSHIIDKIFDQVRLDAFLVQLDGTNDKSKLGANAILAVSLAFARAAALSKKIPLYEYLRWEKASLPIPFVNIINGGAHADNALSIQEFMIVPIGFEQIEQRIQAASEVFHHLRKILKQQGLNTNVGDEGGFAPLIASSHQAVKLIMDAVQAAGYNFSQIKIAIDAAANEFWRDGFYHIDGLKLNSGEMVAYYAEMVQQYPIISLEDPMEENDRDGWKMITKLLGNDIQLVGDDIFATNKAFLLQGIKDGIANSIIIKVNQIGTLSEAIETIKMAKAHGYKAIVSHRSGETEDTFIAHLSVASGCGQIKAGSMCRTDRVAKYNELLRIAEDFARAKRKSQASCVPESQLYHL